MIKKKENYVDITVYKLFSLDSRIFNKIL